jgi:hypothetical protein
MAVACGGGGGGGQKPFFSDELARGNQLNDSSPQVHKAAPDSKKDGDLTKISFDSCKQSVRSM